MLRATTDAGGANSDACASQNGTAGSTSLTVHRAQVGTENGAVAASEVAGMIFDSPATKLAPGAVTWMR